MQPRRDKFSTIPSPARLTEENPSLRKRAGNCVATRGALSTQGFLAACVWSIPWNQPIACQEPRDVGFSTGPTEPDAIIRQSQKRQQTNPLHHERSRV